MRVKDLGSNSAFLHPKPINQSVSIAKSEPFFKMGDWPKSQWWCALNSDELNTLTQEALANNPSIQAVWKKVEVAKEIAQKTKAPLYPKVFFDAEQDWGGMSGNSVPFEYNPSLGRIYDLVDLTVSFKYEFDFWGKYRNQLKAALGEERSQRAEARQVELMITTTLAKAYYALKTNLVRKKLYEEFYLVRSNMLDLNDLLYERAIRSRIEPASSVENLEDIQKEILALDEEIAINVHFINVLRGKSPDSPLSLSDSLSEVPATLQLPKDLSSDLVVRRPDLVASIWHIESLAYEVNIAIADFFPSVNLVGFMGLGSIGWAKLFDWRSATARLQPSIHLPIFRAGEIRANARKNRAELEAAIYSYNDQLLKSLKEVSDGLVFVTKTYKQKEAQLEILSQADLKLNLLQLKYQSGIDGLLSVYEMQVELIERQLQDVMITYQQYTSVIQVIKALGGGYSEKDLTWFKEGAHRGGKSPK